MYTMNKCQKLINTVTHQTTEHNVKIFAKVKGHCYAGGVEISE